MSGVAPRDLASRVARRAERAGLAPSPELVASLTEYLALLGRWNQKINLTALSVNPPNDEAVDRLIVEPLVAARKVMSNDRLCIDIGSGGGSPAFPILLASPALRMVMVESKVRKAAFLREAARVLSLDNAEVANCRLEELLSRVDLAEAADLQTVRAVRLDSKLAKTMAALLRPGGRVLRLVSGSQTETPPLPFVEISAERLSGAHDSRLIVLQRPTAG